MLRKKHILIVGGGFAGVKAALELSNDKHFDVTLLTPRTRFEYHGAMYRSATGKSPLEVVVPLKEIFANSMNVTIEMDSVAELRPNTKEIEGESGRSYSYDALVIAVGYVVNYFNIPGMAEYSETMYSVTEAIQLRHKLVGVFRTKKSGSPVDIAIIGAGPTGVEVASDVQNFAMMVAGKHGIQHLSVRPRLIEAAPRVLSGLSANASAITEKRLKELGVDVLTDTKVLEAKPKKIVTDKGSFTADIIIWTAGNRANPLFSYYPDLFTLDNRQRVIVSGFFQANVPDIFVIGDAASTPYSGMAQNAIHNGLWLAENFKRAALGQRMQAYMPKKPEYVVPVGGEWAVLQTDDGVIHGSAGWKARREADKWALENFLAYDIAQKHLQRGDRIAQF